MDVTYESRCIKCEHGQGGFDGRKFGSYRVYCTHPEVKGCDVNTPPVCGWRGAYPLFVEGVNKKLLVEDVMMEIGYEFYDTLKGRVLTVFESQIDDANKLAAIKSIVEDILRQSEKSVKEYLVTVFKAWGIKK